MGLTRWAFEVVFFLLVKIVLGKCHIDFAEHSEIYSSCYWNNDGLNKRITSEQNLDCR